MRLVMLLLVLGCEPRLAIQPLPPLVAPPARVAIGMGPFHFVPGERMTWDVTVQGLPVGRADLIVGPHDVRTTFDTQSLAAAFATVHYELVTDFDAKPPAGHDVLVVGGESRGAPAPSGAHTFHTVLGWMRSWVKPGARGGYLQVAHAGKVNRLEVSQPIEETIRGEKLLRVDCTVRDIAVSIWFTRDPDAVPMRIQAIDDDIKVTAELVDFHVE